MQSYLLVMIRKTSICLMFTQGRCLALKRLSDILCIVHKTQQCRMPGPANQIADVMFLCYTASKLFLRSLHEKLRITGRTAERKKVAYNRFQSDC